MDDLTALLEGQGLAFETLLIVGGLESNDEVDGRLCLNYADVPTFTRESKVDLGVVHDPSPTDVPVISRLRDVLCRRVLIVLESNTWPRNELLALGFVEREAGDDGLRLFLHDLDITNQPREWNNPSNWANPENFDKYRW